MMYTLGIDIGTTNIEYALADDLAKIVYQKSRKNPLSNFGLDVMTRISRACEGKLDMMSQTLKDALSQDIDNIVRESGISIADVKSINIAANTTMIHILMNYDCENLGKYPFSPVRTDAIQGDSSIIGLTDKISLPVNITQGFSAFVGGDIYSGLKTLPSCDDYLFIDMGTNAEMVLVTGSNIYITSAAAGPAFETCAIGHASDAIDALADMLSLNIMDESGLLDDEYFANGYDCLNLHFSQKKIRDFQMAKSAVRTGIDLLTSQIDNSYKQMLRIYIAGNFGYNLNISNCIRLGMFPEWFDKNATAVGNTSLKGTLLDNKELEEFLADKKIKEIYLANLPDFNELYISNMNF